MEETRRFITIDTTGFAEAVEDETRCHEKLQVKLECDALRMSRSDILDVGSGRRFAVLSGALSSLSGRGVNVIASSACAQIIYGSVAFGEEIDGTVVGLLKADQARILAFSSAIRSFMIRDRDTFIRSFVCALVLGIASTVPMTIPVFEIGKRLEEAVMDEYDQILYHLKEEAAAADPGTRHMEVKNDDK